MRKRKSKVKTEQWIAPFGFDFSWWTQMGKETQLEDGCVGCCDSFAIHTNICCLYKLHFFFCSVCACVCSFLSAVSEIRSRQVSQCHRQPPTVCGVVRAACAHIWCAFEIRVRADGWEQETFFFLLLFSYCFVLIRFLDFPHCSTINAQRADEVMIKYSNV